MTRYALAASAALIVLALAGPAAAKSSIAARNGHAVATLQPAGAPIACAVPAATFDPVLPPSPDEALEDKIDQLTGIIADLSDRIAVLEDALDEPDDADGDDNPDGLDLARAKAGHAPARLHRDVRSVPARPLEKGLAPQAL